MNAKKAKRIRKAVKLNKDIMETHRGHLNRKESGQYVWDLKSERGMIQQLKELL
jgi:hypothetical protein